MGSAVLTEKSTYMSVNQANLNPGLIYGGAGKDFLGYLDCPPADAGCDSAMWRAGVLSQNGPFCIITFYFNYFLNEGFTL